MKIVFMGTPQFARHIAGKVHAQTPIDLIITQPDKPVGRKRTLTPPPMKTFALDHGIEVWQPARLHEVMKALLARDIDLIITAAYGLILPKRLLLHPSLGAINVHASLLPKLRGGAPIQRAIERGYETTGVTIMYMSERMDAGDIIAQRATPIAPDETAGQLFETLAHLGGDLLCEVLLSIFQNKITARAQNDDDATYAYTITRDEERLDFTKDAAALERKIRAFYPQPATYFIADGQSFKIYRATLSEGSAAKAGEVIAHHKDGIVIQCAKDALKLLEVKPAGKGIMDGAALVNGIGKQRLPLGSVVGE